MKHQLAPSTQLAPNVSSSSARISQMQSFELFPTKLLNPVLFTSLSGALHDQCGLDPTNIPIRGTILPLAARTIAFSGLSADIETPSSISLWICFYRFC